MSYKFKVEAAVEFDPADYIWRRYKGTRRKTYKKKHHIHDVVLEDGDIYGIRQTRSRTPSYQMRLLKEQNIPYRNFTQKEIEALDKVSRAYTGKIIVEGVQEGRQRRNRKLTPESITEPNRLKDVMFSPRKVPKETLVVDKSYYQWRKMSSGSTPIKITAKKSGKVICVISAGDIVGLRFVKPSFGGYIILPDGQRRQIHSDTYAAIIEAAKILPTRYQRTGLIDVKEVKQVVKKEDKVKPVKINIVTKPVLKVPVEEAPIKRKYDIDEDEIDILEQVKKTHRAVRSVRRQIAKEAPEIFDAPDEFEEEDEDSVAPVAEDNEFDDNWLDGDDDDDFEEEEPSTDEPDDDEPDSEEGAPGEDEPEDDDDLEALVDSIAQGDVVRFKQAPAKEFIFLHEEPLERNPNIVELFFHERTKNDDDTMYRVRVNTKYTMRDFKQDGAEIIETIDDDEELKELQNAVDLADIKPMSFFKG